MPAATLTAPAPLATPAIADDPAAMPAPAQPAATSVAAPPKKAPKTTPTTAVPPPLTVPGLRVKAARTDMQEAARIVAGAISSRSALPILTHIHIGSTSDNKLEFMATDLEIMIKATLSSVSMTRPGKVTVGSRNLLEYLRALPDKGEIEFAGQANHSVQFLCDKTSSVFLGLPASQYPIDPPVAAKATFTMSQRNLRQMIEQVIYAAGVDKTRAVLCGMYLQFDVVGNKYILKAAATDVHRLAIKSAWVETGAGKIDVIVPTRTIEALHALLTEEDGNVAIAIGTNKILFILPGKANIQISSLVVAGQYPNYTRIIPSEFTTRVVLPVKAFLQAVRRCAIPAREDSFRVVFETKGSKIALSAKSNLIGQNYEEIDAEVAGPDIKTAFNSTYLIDALSTVRTDSIQVELLDGLKPAVIRPMNNSDGGLVPARDSLALLMPMQIV